VARNLRISLSILSIGFAIEGIGEVYTRFVAGSDAPGLSFLYLLPLALTGLGLLFVWVGREEWDKIHLVRVRTAHEIFGASLLGAVVGPAVLAVLYLVPSLGVPLWAQVVFGAALGSLVFGTFVTYAYLVFHLVTLPGRVAVGLALFWSFVVSLFVGIAMAGALPSLLALIGSRSLTVPAFVTPVDYLASYLFVAYFLLLVAYVEAHVAVARGLVRVPMQPGVPVARRPVPKGP
jgi:hypothetical protein